MMEAAIHVKPFGFDRVFRFATAAGAEPAAVDNSALHQRIEQLEAELARRADDHEIDLHRARAEGVQIGLNQARGERQTALLAATDALHAAIDDLDARFAVTADAMMRDAADVAYAAAEMIAGHAVEREPARALDEALDRVLRQVARGTRLGIRVHPTLVADVEQAIAVRVSKERRKLSLTVIEDANVAAGDAQIFWDEGGLAVDADARRAAVLAELGPLLREKNPE